MSPSSLPPAGLLRPPRYCRQCQRQPADREPFRNRHEHRAGGQPLPRQPGLREPSRRHHQCSSNNYPDQLWQRGPEHHQSRASRAPTPATLLRPIIAAVRWRQAPTARSVSPSRLPPAGTATAALNIADNVSGSPADREPFRNRHRRRGQPFPRQSGLRKPGHRHHQCSSDDHPDQLWQCGLEHHQSRGLRAPMPATLLRPIIAAVRWRQAPTARSASPSSLPPAALARPH